jgi:ATP citrate (pro-S)-lyase
MPNKKLSEYQIKKLFGFECSFINTKSLNNPTNTDEKYVVKIDNGVKHRMLSGLVKLNYTKGECYDWVHSRGTNDNYIVEKVANYDNSREYYISIRPSSNNYNEILFTTSGGIHLDNPEAECMRYLQPLDTFVDDYFTGMEHKLVQFIKHIYMLYLKYHFTFLECNPFVFDKLKCEYLPLDITGTIDSDAVYLFSREDRELIEMDYIHEQVLSQAEEAIKALDERTGGSLKFTLLNPNGTVWTLVAGGGASVVYTDAIVNRGYKEQLANYGEYSGDPQEELVEAYCDQIFNCMKKVSQHKTLFIGGAIANFTDIYATFSGIIKSIHKNHCVLKDTDVYVRRGGPNCKKALIEIKKVLDAYGIYNEVYDQTTNITKIVEIALTIIQNKDTMINQIHNTTPKPVIAYIDGYEENNLINIDRNTKCTILGFHKNAIQRMLDFDYTCGKLERSVACVVEPRNSKTTLEPFFYGNESILLPIYTNIKEALSNHEFQMVINFLSFRSAYESTLALLDTSIKTVVIIAEGIPELYTRRLSLAAEQKGKIVLGPATVGGIFGGAFRIANTGGSLENIISCNLHNRGNVGFVSRSGGLLNEMCSIISRCTRGIHSAISIGGDRYPCTSFTDIVMSYENNPEIDVIVCLGEVGGNQELKLGHFKKDGSIKKPIVAYCIGTSASLLGEEVQFGHAGASATSKYETASYKNYYMKDCGIVVPNSFEELEETIRITYNSISNSREIHTAEPQRFHEHRKMPLIYSGISNETGEELRYNNVPISELFSMDAGIGKTIGHLWFKKDIPEWFSKYIEIVLILTADHGAMVSGAINTIVSSRANKDLVSSLCSGLLTIGDRFGGALNESAKQFLEAKQKYTPHEFVNKMKADNRLIMGIGHKVKTVENPDKRVELLKWYVLENFPKYEHVKYSLEVEKITTQKKNNLILNVDGFLANSLLDAFGLIMNETEFLEIINNDFINAFFVLGRTIGFIGHWYDQKRQKQGLFRMPEHLVQYLD